MKRTLRQTMRVLQKTQIQGRRNPCLHPVTLKGLKTERPLRSKTTRKMVGESTLTAWEGSSVSSALIYSFDTCLYYRKSIRSICLSQKTRGLVQARALQAATVRRARLKTLKTPERRRRKQSNLKRSIRRKTLQRRTNKRNQIWVKLLSLRPNLLWPRTQT